MNQIGIPNVIFEELYSAYADSFSDGNGWNYYCKKFGYSNPEQLRSLFRRERKRRNLPSKNDIIQMVQSKSGVNNDIMEVKENPYQKFIVNKKLPKVILFDLETSPILANVWGLWNQNIQPDFIEKDWVLMSWSAKLLYDSEVKSDTLNPQEAIDRNDERIVRSLWEILDSADIVIAHNGKQFDIPRANTRFLYYKLIPPSFSKVIDTLEICRKNFGFTSNKLDSISGALNLERKRKTEWSLWLRCLHGEEDALKEMQLYNAQDVNVLEDVYMEIRSWIRPHPNFALWGDEINSRICPTCGSKNLKENGYYYTQVSKFLSFRCNDCGALSRAKQNLLSIEEKKILLQ